MLKLLRRLLEPAPTPYVPANAPHLFAPAGATFVPQEVAVSVSDGIVAPPPSTALDVSGVPPVEAVDARSFVQRPGPPLTPDVPNEREDSPEERQRLMDILRDDRNLSGLPGYALLDQYKIPPSTVEFALRDGDIARAERGYGLARKHGGPW